MKKMCKGGPLGCRIPNEARTRDAIIFLLSNICADLEEAETKKVFIWHSERRPTNCDKNVSRAWRSCRNFLRAVQQALGLLSAFRLVTKGE